MFVGEKKRKENPKYRKCVKHVNIYAFERREVEGNERKSKMK